MSLWLALLARARPNAMEMNISRNADFQSAVSQGFQPARRNADFRRNWTLNRRMNQNLPHDGSSAPNLRQPRIASVGFLRIASDNLGWLPQKPNLSEVISTCPRLSAQKSSFPPWRLGFGASFQRSNLPSHHFCTVSAPFRSEERRVG